MGLLEVAQAHSTNKNIVMFRKEQPFLPAFFCLLMKKSKQVNLPTFRTIYKELAPHFCGESVHQDFQSATEKIIRQVLTECSTENIERVSLAKCCVHGCMFHVCKCCLDRLKKVGLITRYYDSRGPFRYWVRQVMMLCLLPAKHIRPTWVNYLSHQEFPDLLSTREQLSLVEFKDYFFDQWIEDTNPNFLSVFGIDINSNNALESYNKKLNARIGSKKPNIWVYVETMNEMLDNAVIDLQTLQKGERITRNQPRLSDENLMLQKHAQREILAERFTPIQFINYLVENWGTKFFSQINTSEKTSNDEKKSPEKIPQEAQKPELCIECSTPRIGSSWGYMHAVTIHSPVCTSCKTNSQNGDPCPLKQSYK